MISLQDYSRYAALPLQCASGGRAARPGPLGRQGLLTIITVTFNSARTLARTVDSVAAQTYARIEYIVIDGGSTDGTLDLIRRREDDIALWLSEPDSGISDAFNKGIALAGGEFIALVNSDDWLEPDQMRRAVEALQRTRADFVFGNMKVHGADGTEQFELKGDPEYRTRIRHEMPDLNHPSMVCRREAYERYGLYDTELRVAMDYEWLLRAHIGGAKGMYVPELTSHMGDGGVSNHSIRMAFEETRSVSVRHGYPPMLAGVRHLIRLAKLRVRLIIERWISRNFARTVRSLIHRGFIKSGAAEASRAVRRRQ